jgi:hypothetical protein
LGTWNQQGTCRDAVGLKALAPDDENRGGHAFSGSPSITFRLQRVVRFEVIAIARFATGRPEWTCLEFRTSGTVRQFRETRHSTDRLDRDVADCTICLERTLCADPFSLARSGYRPSCGSFFHFTDSDV